VGANDAIADKPGAWSSCEGTSLGQAPENSKNYLAENPELLLEIENKIRAKYELPLAKMAEIIEAKEIIAEIEEEETSKKKK